MITKSFKPYTFDIEWNYKLLKSFDFLVLLRHLLATFRSS